MTKNKSDMIIERFLQYVCTCLQAVLINYMHVFTVILSSLSTVEKVQLSDIKDVYELEYLSIKQLKKLLNTNRVNYKGYIKK